MGLGVETSWRIFCGIKAGEGAAAGGLCCGDEFDGCLANCCKAFRAVAPVECAQAAIKKIALFR